MREGKRRWYWERSKRKPRLPTWPLLGWPVAMVLVLPGLLLGGSADPGQPMDAAITALLSVDAEPPATEGFEEVLHVQALDQPEADLLSHLDACAAFINRARERGGTALVRW